MHDEDEVAEVVQSFLTPTVELLRQDRLGEAVELAGKTAVAISRS